MRPVIYPWEEWFKVKHFVLHFKKDYKCAAHGMAQQIRNAAKRRDLRVSLRIDKYGTIFAHVLKGAA